MLRYGVVLAVALAGVVGASSSRADVVPAHQRGAGAGVAAGSTFIVEPPSARYARELDPRERRDQVRDWAVLGTVARLALTPEQVAAATYELPPARLSYLDELYAFEYGRGRRAYVNGRVLLFRDDDDPDPQATIGRLADRVRMENGDGFAKAEIYVVRDDRDAGTIEVTREPDVSRAALFSPEYGYVEGEGTSLPKLAAWLAHADDLTFAQVSADGRLVLGGRRFADSRTPNLSAEDVAALYQAHINLGEPQREARVRLAKLAPPVRAAVARMVVLLAAGKPVDELSPADAQLISGAVPMEQLAAVAMDSHLATASPAPGFSLDPTWLPDAEAPDHPAMLARLRDFAADPCGNLRKIAASATKILAEEPDPTRRTGRGLQAMIVSAVSSEFQGACAEIARDVAPEVRKVASTLAGADPTTWDTAFAPYYQLLERLVSGSQAAQIAWLALKFHADDTRVQCARYDGLAGTRVGMSLFYTDLMAKLWESVDYGLSAPAIQVPGFLTAPAVDLPVSFKDEAHKHPYTRLWFGPRANAVSRQDQGRTQRLVFGHSFSRIYAAGSNPIDPSLETLPAEDSRRTLGWWDRHFDDVADYEPQFHLQNQIMKWSLITAALAERSSSTFLGLLRVSHDLHFLDWQHQNRSTLRFSEDLPAVHTAIPNRECIPILASYPFESFGEMRNITGGVGTATRAGPAAAPRITPTMPLGQRKPFTTSLGGSGELAGNGVRVQPIRQRTTITFGNAKTPPTNRVSGPVDLGKPVVTYERGAVPREIVIKSGRAEQAIGDLTVGPKPGAPQVTAMRWEAGAVERGLEKAPITATNSSPSTALRAADEAAKLGDVDGAARVYRAQIKAAHSADDVARTAVSDLARDQPTKLLADLRALEGRGAEVSVPTRDALVGAIKAERQPALAAQVEDMLTSGTKLGRGAEVAVRDGKVVVTRDVSEATMATAKRVAPTNLAEQPTYIDGAVRAAHDGYLPNTGGNVARWRAVRGVKVEELKATSSGALPDRIRTPAGRVYERSPASGVHGSDVKNSLPSSTPIKLYLVTKCDDEHKTATTDDDC